MDDRPTLRTGNMSRLIMAPYVGGRVSRSLPNMQPFPRPTTRPQLREADFGRIQSTADSTQSALYPRQVLGLPCCFPVDTTVGSAMGIQYACII